MTRAGQRPTSPLARELGRVVRIVAVIAISIGALFFGTALVLGLGPSDGFLFAIGVTVALVPEGLLPTVTLSLAIAAQRMAARSAVVRRLEAAETLAPRRLSVPTRPATRLRAEVPPSGRADSAGPPILWSSGAWRSSLVC
jgi:E1-E2 ATPase